MLNLNVFQQIDLVVVLSNFVQEIAKDLSSGNIGQVDSLRIIAEDIATLAFKIGKILSEHSLVLGSEKFLNLSRKTQMRIIKEAVENQISANHVDGLQEVLINIELIAGQNHDGTDKTYEQCLKEFWLVDATQFGDITSKISGQTGTSLMDVLKPGLYSGDEGIRNAIRGFFSNYLIPRGLILSQEKRAIEDLLRAS